MFIKDITYPGRSALFIDLSIDIKSKRQEIGRNATVSIAGTRFSSELHPYAKHVFSVETLLINCAISLFHHLILFYLWLSPPYLFCPLIFAVHIFLPLCHIK
jgi:hypothetical protein